MTEERNCGTCKLSSFNNGTGKGCGSFGVSDCDRYSKWQPIQKASSFQMTEEEAYNFIKVIFNANCSTFPSAMAELKKYGYIRKSELVELVEEAEESRREYIEEHFEERTETNREYEMVFIIDKLYKALQALKKDHPEFGGKK